MNSVTLGFETILYFKLEILKVNFNLVQNDLSRIFGSGHFVQCREMFCGCALKASAAEGVAEEGGEEKARCLARPPENAGFLTPSQRSKKARTRRAFAGAEKRIRTSGRVTPVTRFPIVLLKPLRHLCMEQKPFYNNSGKNATSFRPLS